MRRGVFPHEGGYSNHPSDPGGPTNWGITLVDARKYWRPMANADDVRNMPKSVAEDIYDKQYATPLHYDDLPAGLDYTVLDYGINSGVGRSGKVLRRVCGLPDSDYHVTDEVLRAVSQRDKIRLIGAVWDERLRFLKSLRTWPTFGAGWQRRCNEGRALAHSLALSARPPVLANAPAAGKGAVPAPKAVKNVIKGGPAVAAAGGLAWITEHPWATGVIFLGSIAITVGVVYTINRWHQSRQEAATPGIAPVPIRG